MANKKCAVDGCEKPGRLKRGFCNNHYYRFMRHGSPHGGRASQGEPIAFLNAAISSHTAECIIWPFKKNRGGYGQIYIGGKLVSAHRAALDAVEPMPFEGALALHSLDCTSRECVNHLHLRWGTQQENMDDRSTLGRGPTGERHGASKLKESEVLSIRSSNRTLAELSDQYGVSESAIHAIKKHVNWRHI